MRRVRDSSQYRSRIRRDDVMDGVCNVLGDNFQWPPSLDVPPALVTASASTGVNAETPVSETPDTLSLPPGLLTASVSTVVE